MLSIETLQLSKTFNIGKTNQVEAVRNVSLKIHQGECLLLKGRSGSGKTTLLTLLSGLARPTSGEYTCLGKKVSRWSERFLTEFRRAHIGIIFQHFNLIESATAYRNIAIPLIPRPLKTTEIDKAVRQAADAVGISHRLEFKTAQLSGGEKQRVAIARALVANPDIVFADEPTSHLDAESSEAIFAVFEKLKSENKTLIITTHDPRLEQHKLIDRLIRMEDGQVRV
ncbi:MAG: ABC transporter ATP-binding protein [Bernardetiaceae bacterium]|nr:ABC transporter ATP-binding protein [Bernardetiaceae bacterium]